MYDNWSDRWKENFTWKRFVLYATLGAMGAGIANHTPVGPYLDNLFGFSKQEKITSLPPTKKEHRSSSDALEIEDFLVVFPEPDGQNYSYKNGEFSVLPVNGSCHGDTTKCLAISVTHSEYCKELKLLIEIYPDDADAGFVIFDVGEVGISAGSIPITEIKVEHSWQGQSWRFGDYINVKGAYCVK